MSKYDELTDTPEHKRARQQKRRDALEAVAQYYGFESWSTLSTAIKNKEVEIKRRNKMTPQVFEKSLECVRSLRAVIENALMAAKEERELDFDARVTLKPDREITIDTRISRDSRRSNNGGEYSFWLKIWPNEYGGLLVQEFCTCDHWQPDDEPQLFDGILFDYAVGVVDECERKYGVPLEVVQ